jgi:hypothetical protein
MESEREQVKQACLEYAESQGWLPEEAIAFFKRASEVAKTADVRELKKTALLDLSKAPPLLVNPKTWGLATALALS